jgi:adenylate kinase
MRLIITGSPGTGKSVIARLLARKLSIPLIDLRKVVLEKGLRARNHEVDIGKLSRALAFLRKRKDYVVEGHLACEMRLPADAVVVLRCDPEVLRARLGKRGYGKKKLGENLMAEMLDYCTQRCKAVYGAEPLELDTSARPPEESASYLMRALRKGRKRLDRVDHSQSLKAFLGINK